MRPHFRWIACGLPIVVGGGIARDAWAEASEETVRIEYQSPPSCPSETAFFAAVLARTPRARRATTTSRTTTRPTSTAAALARRAGLHSAASPTPTVEHGRAAIRFSVAPATPYR